MLNRMVSTRRAFGQAPEELSLFGLEVERVGEEQLAHVVAEADVELAHGLSDAVVEGFGAILDHSRHCLSLLALEDGKVLRLDDLLQRLGVEGEDLAEDVSRPFDAVHCLLGEHLQSAVRDLRLFVGVVLASVVLSLVGNDDLDVSLRAKRAAFKERNLVLNAPLVHVLSGLDVVERVGNDLSAAEELVGEDLFGLLTYLVQPSDDVAFETRVELQERGAGCR